MEQISILGIASDKNADALKNLLEDERFQWIDVVEADNENLPYIVKKPMDVVVVYDGDFSPVLAEFLEKINIARSDSLIYLITRNCDMETLTRAMQCGVRNVFTMDTESEKICHEIESDILKQQKKYDTTGNSINRAHIISVFGTKGGTGKTMISVNLAVALQSIGKKVLIVDLDLQFGDVGVFLDIPKFDTISDLIGEGVFSNATVNSYLYQHSSGVHALCAPVSPEYAELVKPEHINKIISAVSTDFDFIIFDLGPTIDEVALQALEICNDIYFVTNPEISTLKNTKVCMRVLDTLGQASKVKMVLNKEGSSDIRIKDAEAALDMAMTFVVPSETRNVIASINRGIPIVLATPKSKVSKAIKSYAALL